jgi:hypothetical protein
MSFSGNTIIGYYMRSGSTLLQHLLDSHSRIRAFGDLNSIFTLPGALAGRRRNGHRVFKPLDLFYLHIRRPFYQRFDRRIWLARDPRDSYLSAMEAGPHLRYFLWPPGRRKLGIDTGLLRRWKRTYRHYFRDPDRWHLVRYEDLVTKPRAVLAALFQYLEVPFEKVFPFRRYRRIGVGGDHKLVHTNNIHTRSLGRHRGILSREQNDLFREYLGEEMERLGYPLYMRAHLDESPAATYSQI